jgi:AcrR family transcriptional regulator
MRTNLLDAALRLFRTRGYESTTVQDIANAADVAKGTFFSHFPTKEHVLMAYHQEMGRHVLEVISSRSFTSAERAVQFALGECAAWIANDPAMGRLVTRVFFGSDLLLQSDQQNEAELAAWLHDHIQAGCKRGELKSSLDIPLFISLLIGALSSSTIEWTSGSHAFDLEGNVKKKVRFLFQAARA